MSEIEMGCGDIAKLVEPLKVLPVLTVESCEEAIELSRALFEGGIAAVEITLRTPVAVAAIAAVKEALPDLVVAAGTVTTAEELASVMAAGADFGVSPATSPSLFDAIIAADFPFIPGVATPSEVLYALERGFDHLKLFPAQSVGGVGLLKSLSGPLSSARFCPTGGINQNNKADYQGLSNVFCVGGSWMVDAQQLANKDWAAIKEAAAQAVA